jgi:hypothetical protein
LAFSSNVKIRKKINHRKNKVVESPMVHFFGKSYLGWLDVGIIAYFFFFFFFLVFEKKALNFNFI